MSDHRLAIKLLYLKNTEMNIIELQNLSKSFGNLLAVNDLSLSVPKDSIYGFIGAKIFRTAILIQGQKPSLKNLISYAFKK